MKEGEMELVKVYTKENQVDILMKTFSWDSFHICAVLMDRLDFAAALMHQDKNCRLKYGAPKSLVAKRKVKV